MIDPDVREPRITDLEVTCDNLLTTGSSNTLEAERKAYLIHTTYIQIEQNIKQLHQTDSTAHPYSDLTEWFQYISQHHPDMKNTQVAEWLSEFTEEHIFSGEVEILRKFSGYK